MNEIITLPGTETRTLPLDGMYQRLVRQQETSNDLIVDTRNLEMVADYQSGPEDETVNPSRVALRIPGSDLYHGGISPRQAIRQHAHQQIGDRCGIPTRYYQAMLNGRDQDRDLLTTNVNHWLHNNPERRMLRTTDGSLRAFLSDRYCRIDNLDVLEAALPVVQNNGWKIQECSLTDQRMYVKVVIESMTAEVKVGEPVRWGVVFSNSEIGVGAVRVEPFVLTLACLNGMVIKDQSFRRTHLGPLQNVGILTEKTIAADDQVFLMKVQDTLAAMNDRDRFQKVVANLHETTNTEVPDPVLATEKLSKRVGYDQTKLLNRYATGGDSSLWGLVSALTREAQEVTSYDDQVQLETAAGELAQNPRAWREVLAA